MLLLLPLLLLLAGCLGSCAAQTASSPSPLSATDASTPAATPRVPSSADSADYVIAVLQTAVKSETELNETTLPSVLSLLRGVLQDLQPDVSFTLSVRNITRV